MSVVELLKQKKFIIDWRQQDCIDRIRQHHSTSSSTSNKKDYRVIAFEDPNFKPGCRRFISTTLRDFYLWYRESCPPECRHFYELILESTPCRLYFDLEYQREFNPGVVGPQLVQEFIQVVCRALLELLGIRLDACRDFLILDSSSPKKFSAHLIVHVPSDNSENSADDENGEARKRGERLFPDNVDSLKRIAVYICSKLLQENRCRVRTAAATTAAGDGQWTYLCDLSVYSRNRNFRLYLSSKCGKQETLRLADYCQFYKARSIDQPKHAQIFLDSLVIPLHFQRLPVLPVHSLPPMCALKSALDAFMQRQKNGESGIGTTHPLTIFQRNGEEETASSTAADMLISFGLAAHQPKGAAVAELAGGPAPSPFPRLDQFMLEIFRRFNPLAQIRVWRLICLGFEAPSSMKSQEEHEKENTDGNKKRYQLQYQLTNSRFCLNRGREHKSQNVYWVLCLAQFHFVQRCFDTVDCPNYSSPPFVLPAEMCQHLHSQVQTVFGRMGIAQPQLPVLDILLAKRYKAASDSFNQSVEWREKYGNLELFDPADDETTLVSGSAKKSKRRKRDEDNDDDDDTESITELLDQSSLLD